MKRLKRILFLYTFLIINYTFLVGNSSAQWYIQQTGTTNPLYDIEFINKNTGWACGDGGYIIKTTNGGLNWIQQSNGVPGRPLYGIHPVDSNIVYAVGFFHTFIKTTNGGESWFSLDSGGVGSGSYMCVFFINENTGWISNFESGAYGVKKTTDGGGTLTTIFFNGIPRDLYFKDSLVGIGVSPSAYIFKTIDGGYNWSSTPLAGSGNFYRVSFIDDFTGYTSSTRAVYKTTNFGTSWDSVGRVTPLDIDVTSIEFVNENTGWAGTANSISKTIDGGGSWNVQVPTGVVYSIFAHSDSIVWACGNGGRIWHTDNGGISNIYNISTSIPEDFELFQNYPNPFNSETKIRFSIRERKNYTLIVYDNLGRFTREIFSKTFGSGMYEVTFDALGLSTGVYFFRLSSDENFKTVKSLLLK